MDSGNNHNNAKETRPPLIPTHHVARFIFICYAVGAVVVLPSGLAVIRHVYHLNSRYKFPEFQIEYISVTPLNVSDHRPTSTTLVRWAVGILVTNPNKEKDLSLDGFDIGLHNYPSRQHLFSSHTGAFVLGPNAQKILTSESELGGGGEIADDFEVHMGPIWLQAFWNPPRPPTFDYPCLKAIAIDISCRDIKAEFKVDANTTQSTILSSNNSTCWITPQTRPN